MKLSVCALLLLVVSTTQAGWHGTLDFSDIDQLLAQKHSLLERVTHDFDVFRVGDARMIARDENVKLNGARIGPYRFYIKPKGSPYPYTYELCVETRPTFIDATGQKVPLSRATDFKEELLDISIRPLAPEKCFTP